MKPDTLTDQADSLPFGHIPLLAGPISLPNFLPLDGSTPMHIKALFIVTVSLLIHCSLAAPIRRRDIGATIKVHPDGRQLQAPIRRRGHDIGATIKVHPDGKQGPDITITKQVTIGKWLGSGSEGTVYHVASHDLGDDIDLVVKKKYSPKQEFKNLRQVDQLRASGQQNGYTWAVMEKINGVRLKDTQEYKEARQQGTIPILQEHIHTLMADARVHHMIHDGIVHMDMYRHNALFEEEDGKIVKANLIDWGRAKAAPAPAGEDGQYTQSQLDEMRVWELAH